MFKRILIPVDCSRRNRKALEIAVNISTHYGGSIDLLHVIETIANATFADFQDFYLKLEKKAGRNMDKLTALHQGSPVQITGKTVYGHRVQEILDYAQRHRVDLIIMNSHKTDPKNPVRGWGTISHKIGILSRCPVMLVK